MKKMTILLFFFCFLAACSSAPQQQEQVPVAKELPTYKIGYMICNSEHETLARFLPLSAYLGKKLGVKFETEAIDTIRFTQDVDRLDFTHTNSLLYIILKRFHGVDILAAEKKGSLGHRSQGVIVTLKKSGLTRVEDLKGKTMIFGPMLAPTGFMAQVDILQQHGINPDQDLALYTIPNGSFKHEKVLYGVWFGKYDAGALPLDDVETMASEGRIEADEFDIIAKAEPMPYCNFGVTQRVDAKLAKAFKEAVLAITKEETMDYGGETIRVLDRALVDRYVDITDQDFDIVREMAKRTNMPPYQKF